MHHFLLPLRKKFVTTERDSKTMTLHNKDEGKRKVIIGAVVGGIGPRD